MTSRAREFYANYVVSADTQVETPNLIAIARGISLLLTLQENPHLRRLVYEDIMQDRDVKA